MKTTRTIAMGLVALCTLGLSQATFAGSKKGSKTETPLELRFIGKTNNHPVFELRMNNTEPDVYNVTVKDENHATFFSEKVNAISANFSRTYQLAINEDEISSPGFGVIVEVTSAKTHKTQTYKISSQTTVNESIVVANL